MALNTYLCRPMHFEELSPIGFINKFFFKSE